MLYLSGSEGISTYVGTSTASPSESGLVPIVPTGIHDTLRLHHGESHPAYMRASHVPAVASRKGTVFGAQSLLRTISRTSFIFKANICALSF